MDSLTHIALGACIGEMVAGKKLGKKAMLVGAVAQSFPDIDFMASFWLTPAEDLIAHRGFTHSILFIATTSLLFSLVAVRWRQLAYLPFRRWFLFILLEMAVHIFLDAFNAYGTAWFEPFSHTRISFHALFVIDPFYSIAIGIAAAWLLLKRSDHPERKKWAITAVVLSSLYLGYSLINKSIVDRQFESQLRKQDISYSRFFSTPTPGNTWLWYAVAESESGYYIGYRSVFDQSETIYFQFFSRNAEALDSIADHESLQRLIRFSQGYYVVTDYDGQMVFSDLRFGQMLGWDNPRAPFVFYYYLYHPEDNELIIQRGRFAKWTYESAFSFLRRIVGIRKTAPLRHDEIPPEPAG